MHNGLSIIDFGFLVTRAKFAIRKYDREGVRDLAGIFGFMLQYVTFDGFVSFCIGIELLDFY